MGICVAPSSCIHNCIEVKKKLKKTDTQKRKGLQTAIRQESMVQICLLNKLYELNYLISDKLMNLLTDY